MESHDVTNRAFNVDLRQYTPGSWDEQTPIIRHTIVEGLRIAPELLDAVGLHAGLSQYASKLQLHIVSEHLHRFVPHGVSLVFVLEESHLAAHSWPEKGYLHLDIVTCSKEIDLSAATHASMFAEIFTPQDIRTLKLIY